MGSLLKAVASIIYSLMIVEAEFDFQCPSDQTICPVCDSKRLKCVSDFKVDDFKELRRDLVNISVTGNNFEDKLPVNMFGNCSSDDFLKMYNLKLLNLSRNNITSLHGKTFHCITKLETLDLSHNNWHVNKHTHVFSSMGHLKNLILENTFYEKLDGTKHLAKLAWYINVTGMPFLTDLNLASNEFWSIPNVTQEAFCQLRSLKVLNLSRNNLDTPNLCAGMDKLEVLDLSHNHLPFLSKELMGNLNQMKSLKKLYLDENLFQCDCGMIPFYTWLQNESLSGHVQNRQGLTCFLAFNTANQDQSILSLTLSDLKCHDHITIFNATGVVIGLLFILIVGLFTATLYYKRNSVKMAWQSFFAKPVKLSLIPQSEGYSTVQNHVM